MATVTNGGYITLISSRGVTMKYLAILGLLSLSAIGCDVETNIDMLGRSSGSILARMTVKAFKDTELGLKWYPIQASYLEIPIDGGEAKALHELTSQKEVVAKTAEIETKLFKRFSKAKFQSLPKKNGEYVDKDRDRTIFVKVEKETPTHRIYALYERRAGKLHLLRSGMAVSPRSATEAIRLSEIYRAGEKRFGYSVGCGTVNFWVY